MVFCEDLIYEPLGRGCGVSRNDESVDTLEYITWKVVTAQRIFVSITTNTVYYMKQTLLNNIMYMSFWVF